MIVQLTSPQFCSQEKRRGEDKRVHHSVEKRTAERDAIVCAAQRTHRSSHSEKSRPELSLDLHSKQVASKLSTFPIRRRAFALAPLINATQDWLYSPRSGKRTATNVYARLSIKPMLCNQQCARQSAARQCTYSSTSAAGSTPSSAVQRAAGDANVKPIDFPHRVAAASVLVNGDE